MEYRFFITISKIDISELNRFLKWWQLNGIFLFNDVRLEIKQGKYPSSCSNTGLERGVNFTDPFYRLVQHDQRRQERHESPWSGNTFKDLISAKPDNEGHGQTTDYLNHGMGYTAVLGFQHENIKNGINFLAEPVSLVRLLTEDLDDSGTGYGFMQNA